MNMTDKIAYVEDQVYSVVRKLVPDEKVKVCAVGSAYYANKDYTDIDILVLHEFGSALPDYIENWEAGGSMRHNDAWRSFKRGLMIEGREHVVNLLLYSDRKEAKALADAAEVCRFLTLLGCMLNKDQVCRIHDILMYDLDADSAYAGLALQRN